MARNKRVLTTGEVARICNVAPRTVSKWFDKGQLHGYRIPGSKDRRIPLSELVGFMKAHGMPLDEIDVGKPRVLVLDSEAAVNGVYTDGPAGEGEFEVRFAGTAFEAGLAAREFEPAVLVVDVSLPDVRLEALCRDIRSIRELQGLKCVAVGSGLGVGEQQAALQAGFDAVLAKPFDSRALADTIRKLLDLRS